MTRNFFDGVEFAGKGDLVLPFFKKYLADKIEYNLPQSGMPGNMPVGDEMCIAEIHFPGRTAEDPLLHELMDKAQYRIEYESLYGEKFALDSRVDRKIAR